MVSCQILKKSISPHPFLGQTSSDWPLENKRLCFGNHIWRLRGSTTPNVTTCTCTCTFVAVWRPRKTTYDHVRSLSRKCRFQCDSKWLGAGPLLNIPAYFVAVRIRKEIFCYVLNKSSMPASVHCTVLNTLKGNVNSLVSKLFMT